MERGGRSSSFFIFLKGLLSMWLSSFSSAFMLLTLRRYKLRTLKKLSDMDDEAGVVLVVCWRTFIVEIVGNWKRTHASLLATGCCQVVPRRWDHREHCFRESNQRQSFPSEGPLTTAKIEWILFEDSLQWVTQQESSSEGFFSQCRQDADDVDHFWSHLFADSAFSGPLLWDLLSPFGLRLPSDQVSHGSGQLVQCFYRPRSNRVNLSILRKWTHCWHLTCSSFWWFSVYWSWRWAALFWNVLRFLYATIPIVESTNQE